MAMHIDRYSFGRIRVDGSDFDKDVILLGGEVICPWWREAGGHVFAPVDLRRVLEAAPEVVVLGTGRLGLVKVRTQTRHAFEAVGTRVVSGRTGPMVEEFNRLAAAGVDVAAALHLTC